MFRRHLPAILAVILLVALLAAYTHPSLVAYTHPSSSEEEKVSGEVTLTTGTTAPGPTPEQLQLEKDVATITYATAVHEHRLAVEWEAAAEAQRVFDAQAAEQARKERQARAAATPAAPTPAPTASGGSGCVIADYICARESGHDYTAYNASSGAGGMYQMLPSTSNAVAASIGRYDLVGVPPHTMAPADQDLLASQLAPCHWQAPNYCAG